MFLGWGSEMRAGYLILGLVAAVTLQAETYKAVFDCSSDRADYIKSRMWLVGKTKEMFEKRGDRTDFVITLHGGCVPMVSREYKDIVDDEDVASIGVAQKLLTDLVKKQGVKVIACAMSLDVNGIEREEVLPFVTISPNSFVDTITLQNKGYALMTFK
ncbi:MAG: DsrE family protein [Sulfurovum sp.]|nr:DsrE family protein [Sulfurovum sp.]